MNKISTEDMSSNSTPVIVSHVNVSGKASSTRHRLARMVGADTAEWAWATALRCANDAAKAVHVRDAADVIAYILAGKHNVDGLLKFATDPVWEETGITVDIYYDEEE